MKKLEDTDFWKEQASLLTLLRIRKLIKIIPDIESTAFGDDPNPNRDVRHEDYKQVFKYLS